MNRALSLITIVKSDDATRTISGIASTPEVDRVGDVVEPLGASFKLPLPLLWQHQHDAPVGHVLTASAGADGVRFTARFAQVPEPGRLRDRLEEAWQSVKHGLVRAVSIGFIPTETAVIATGLQFLQWVWLELSVVTVPANESATIETIKRLDLAARSAGHRVVRLDQPVARQLAPRRVVRLTPAERARAGLPPAGASIVEATRAALKEPFAETDGLAEMVARTTGTIARTTDNELAAVRRRLESLERR